MKKRARSRVFAKNTDNFDASRALACLIFANAGCGNPIRNLSRTGRRNEKGVKLDPLIDLWLGQRIPPSLMLPCYPSRCCGRVLTQGGVKFHFC
jgi:hypothetical protein